MGAFDPKVRKPRTHAMSCTVGSAVPSAEMTSRAAMAGVSLFRLYALRASYLLIAVGLGVYIWPAIFHHTQGLRQSKGWTPSVPLYADELPATAQVNGSFGGTPTA